MTDSDEVVVLSTASSAASSPRRASSSLFSAVSSEIASTTNVVLPSASRSVVTVTLAASKPSPRRSQAFAIAFVARAADASDRAHSTCPGVRVAQAARPVAIAPLPAIPSFSPTSILPS